MALVEEQARPAPLSIWLSAARPKTLGAAIAPVLAGTALAAAQGVMRPWVALAALFGALCIQIGTNLFNDWADFKKGADGDDRLGPPRAVASGWLSPETVLLATGIVFGLAALFGLYLVAVAGWPVVIIGVASIAAGLAYTGGPHPLAYRGLGEVFVILFFGLVATAGTHFVQAGSLDPAALLAGLPLGLIAAAILVVNNLRDREGDAAAGKRTLAVRFGARFARAEFAVLLSLAFACPLVAWLGGLAGPGWLLSWLSVPAAVWLARAVAREDGAALNPRLGQTGQLELGFAVLLALGMLL